ncbi:MAG: hypothetical protein WCS94_14170 [Verrucomicrobiota bacterium]
MAEIPDIQAKVMVFQMPPPILTEVQESVRQKLAMAGDEAEFTPEEFAELVSMPVTWVRKNLAKIPGRCGYSNKCQRIHWGTHKDGMRRRSI